MLKSISGIHSGRCGFQHLEFGIHNLESRIQYCPGLPCVLRQKDREELCGKICVVSFLYMVVGPQKRRIQVL